MAAQPVAGISGAAQQGPPPDSEESDEAEVSSFDSDDERWEKAQHIRKSFKSPKGWMLVVGAILAACAGVINVVAFSELQGLFVSHLTGSLSKTAMELEGVHDVGTYDPHDAMVQFLVILSFVLGAFLCGLVIDKNSVHFGGHSFYGVALMGECALLCAATALAPERPVACQHGCASAYFSAMACGLQNAMCTSHFTAVVRTTHVTGSFTDIGSTFGRIVAILARRKCFGLKVRHVDKAEIWVDSIKLRILLLLCFGFFLGCFVGGYAQTQFGAFAWLIPAAITGSMGFAYSVLTHVYMGVVRRYEEKQLQEEVIEVEEHMERAAQMLQRARTRLSQHSQDVEAGQDHAATESIIQMEHEFEHCLEIVRDFSRLNLSEASTRR